KGLIVEQRVGRNLFIEAGLNEENQVNPATDYLRGAQRSLQVDANLYLPDRVTPNPNFGRYYVEGAGRGVVYLRRSREQRVMASYDLDLARTTRFGKWLGSHRFAVMYQRSHSVSANQDALARLVPAGTPLDAASLATLPASAFQLINFRSYLSNPA